MATPAPTLKLLWDQVHERWHQTRFDGIMGDQAHQARKSDHNDGNALDIGINPERDPLGDTIAQILLHDERTKYVIWNRRIWTPDRGWHAYTGSSPHTEHVHISIYAAARDDLRPWLNAQQEDDMFSDTDRATLGATYQSAAQVGQRQPWAFTWFGALHAVHVTAAGDLVHSTWTGSAWQVETVAHGCDPTVEPVVQTEAARVRVWCRSSDLSAVVHTVYETGTQRWSSARIGG